MKKPCIKCLIADMDYDECFANILEYIKAIPEEKRVEGEIYHKRLEICRSCDQLANGVCAKCGCFVELRAIKPNMYCASEKKYW